MTDFEWQTYFASWCIENGVDTTDWRGRMKRNDNYMSAYDQWKFGASDRIINGQLLRAKLDTIPQEPAI